MGSVDSSAGDLEMCVSGSPLHIPAAKECQSLQNHFSLRNESQEVGLPLSLALEPSIQQFSYLTIHHFHDIAVAFSAKGRVDEGAHRDFQGMFVACPQLLGM